MGVRSFVFNNLGVKADPCVTEPQSEHANSSDSEHTRTQLRHFEQVFQLIAEAVNSLTLVWDVSGEFLRSA